MFASHKKLYFVFADSQDAFFTDSMLRLNTADYLWLMLRKSGYSNVFFIRETESGLSLELSDSDSAKAYSVGKQKLSWKKKYDAAETIESDVMQLGRWVMRKKKLEEGKSALIFQGMAFQKCFGNGPEQLKNFLTWQKQSQDTVILLLPMRLSQREMMLFTSKTSVFARLEGGDCLSRPVYDVIHAEGAVPIFDRLSEKLGPAMIQLSVFSYSRIRTMLRWAAIQHRWDIPEEKLWDYANYLYWYVYSPELRDYGKEPLSRFSNGRELAECLLQDGIFDVIDERLKVLRHNMPDMRLIDILYQICPLQINEDRTWIQITHDNELLLRLARMAFPASFMKIIRQRDELTYDFQKWLEMRRWIIKPNTHSPEQKRMEGIERFMEICRTRMQQDDMDTALRAARGIYENALELYAPLNSRDRLNAYEIYLEISKINYDLRRKVLGFLGGMPQAQQKKALENNVNLKIAIKSLEDSKQMLSIMTDTFLLPGARYGSLLRDAVAMLNKMSADGATEGTVKQELTKEEQEKLILQYANMI